MKFKIEISLLVLAIMLYAVSAFCYSYETSVQGLSAESANNPYRIYVFPLTVISSVLLAAAAILYSKRK